MKEIYYLLLSRIALVQEEQHGEHYHPLNKKKAPKVVKTYHYYKNTRKRLNLN